MTKNDLKDYAIKFGCEAILLESHKANIIRFINPKNNKKAWLRLPFDNIPVKEYSICLFCSKLGIPIPDKKTRFKT